MHVGVQHGVRFRCQVKFKASWYICTSKRKVEVVPSYREKLNYQLKYMNS